MSTLHIQLTAADNPFFTGAAIWSFGTYGFPNEDITNWSDEDREKWVALAVEAIMDQAVRPLAEKIAPMNHIRFRASPVGEFDVRLLDGTVVDPVSVENIAVGLSTLIRATANADFIDMTKIENERKMKDLYRQLAVLQAQMG